MKFTSSSIVLSSLAILLLPLIIFIIFWFKIFWSILFIIFIAFIGKNLIPLIRKNFPETHKLPAWQFFSGTILLLCWIIYGGIGKIGYQNFDYVKHNAIFHDLFPLKLARAN
jgi:hypothetical protein